ncbi:MAG TPA: hypothetical protein VFJ16_28795 [Longimicrobium sp.]|nr:hypothetical protein [Longimicrobium sp.]
MSDIDLRAESAADAITTPQRYRELRPGMDGFRLVSATVTVTLLPDPCRARYDYQLELETIGPVLARYWCYHLPVGSDEVEDLRAWDERGRLLARLLYTEGPGSRVEVRLRQPVKPGERYTFSYSYESSIGTVVARDGARRTVTYSDWVIFNIPCDVLHVHVEPPATARVLATVPAAHARGDGCVTWRVTELRALETVSFVVAYRVSTYRPGYRRIAAAFHNAIARNEDDFTEPPRGW